MKLGKLLDVFKFGGGKKPLDIRTNNKPVGPNYTTWDPVAGRNVPVDMRAVNAKQEARIIDTNNRIKTDKNWWKAHQVAGTLMLGGMPALGALGLLGGSGAAAAGAAGGAPAAGSMAGMSVGTAGGAAIPASVGSAGPYVAPAVKGGGAIAPVVKDVAPAVGGKMKLGTLLDVGKLAGNAFSSLWGARKAGQTAKYEADLTASTLEKQMELERQRLAEEKAQFLMQQEELKRQWEAEQAFRKQQFDVSEEERLWRRRIEEEREARSAGRRAHAAAARAKLRDYLGMN